MLLTVPTALILGGAILVSSVIAAAVVARRWPRRTLKHHHIEEGQLSVMTHHEFGASESAECLGLSLSHLTAAPSPNRSRALKVGLRLA